MRNGLFIVGLGFIIIAAFLFYFVEEPNGPPINNFYDCASLHFDVVDKYPAPRTCSANGKIFVEEEPLKVKVFYPQPDQAIESPLKIRGEARGIWFFEASFPIRLKDANGKEIAVAIAQAQGEWMTTNFVPFEVSLIFDKPSTPTGTLVFQKDNPSGLPEHDDEFSFEISFAGDKISDEEGRCVISGCSSQICSEEQVMTTCEYRPEYACYKSAKCERQENGKCGWTESESLKVCLNNNL